MNEIPRHILITGGTGTFGRAFAKRLLEQHEVERVCIFSRDEHKQAFMRQELSDDSRLRWFVGDVRDLQRLSQAMDGCELVVHAAALKRVEVGEYNPAEMVKTNIGGALNVIDAAARPLQHGRRYPRRVIALSTDKACAPTNAYGATKLTMEKLMLAANNTVGPFGPQFAVTRYGNVAGSNGSVIPTWRRALNDRRPIRITDPAATRFWMTIDQAIDLVLNTARQMHGGEMVVPSLPAYRLEDLLNVMIDGYEDPVELVYAGLGRGEKMHESMISDTEAANFWANVPDGYWISYPENTRIEPGPYGHAITGITSDKARRMTMDELRKELPLV